MKKLSKTTLNFLPKNAVASVPYSKDFYYVLSLAMVIILFISVTFIQINIKKKREVELARVIYESDVDAETITRINKEIQLIEQLATSRNSLKSITDKRFLWGDHFKEISLLIPRGVWISSMKVKFSNETKDIFIKGESMSYKNVSKFYGRLSQSINFSNILLTSSSIDDNLKSPFASFTFGTKESYDEGASR